MRQRSEPKAGGGECLEETHYPCEDITPGEEFIRIEVPKGSPDRLMSADPPVQLSAQAGRALRAEVRDGDQAWNPDANDGQGGPVLGGWRAEAQGASEEQRETPVRYEWTTLLPDGYPVNPQGPGSPDDPPWQLIFQWHQGGTDRGSSPPVAFIVKKGSIWLDLHEPHPTDVESSVRIGTWYVGPASTGAWHRFRAEIVWHIEHGTIKVWFDGDPVMFSPPGEADPGGDQGDSEKVDTLTGLPTLFPSKPVDEGAPAPPPPSVYLKVGLYREAVTTDPPGPYVVFHDEIHRCVLNPQAAAKWWQKIDLKNLTKWLKDLIDRLPR